MNMLKKFPNKLWRGTAKHPKFTLPEFQELRLLGVSIVNPVTRCRMQEIMNGS